jgi:hypothetical protein
MIKPRTAEQCSDLYVALLTRQFSYHYPHPRSMMANCARWDLLMKILTRLERMALALAAREAVQR